MANAALEQADELRRKALAEQAGEDLQLQAPVPLPTPQTAPSVAVPPASHEPLYPPGATSEDLARALEAKRGHEFVAQMLDAGATIAKGAGGKGPANPGAALRQSADQGVKEVLQRRAVADEDRKNKAAVDSANFAKWLFAKLPVTQGTAQAIGSEGMGQVAGLNPQTLIGENVAYEKAKKEAGKGGTLDRYDMNSPISKQAQEGYIQEKGIQDEEGKAAVHGLSYDEIQKRRSAEMPAMRMGFNPITGAAFSYNRKDPKSVQDAMGQGGGAVDPNTGIAGTPKMKLEGQKKLLSLGSPPPDFAWHPDVVQGKKAPPSAAETKEAKDIISSGAQILDQSQPILSFLKKYPNGIPAGEDVTAIKPFLQSVRTAAQQNNKMGVLREFDLPILNGIAADPSNLKNILKSAVGMQSLVTEWNALQNETKQRMWTAGQSADMVPNVKGRLHGFQPQTALPTQPPAIGTETKVQEPETKVGKSGKRLVKIDGEWHYAE